MSSRPVLPPLLVLALGILAASTGAIFVRHAQASAPSLVIAALRLGLATLLLAPWVILRHRRVLAALDPRDWLLAALSGVFLALHFAAWISSLAFTSVASSVVFVTTTPLWVALLAPLLLKERLGPRVWGGLVLALAGGVVIALGEGAGGPAAHPLKGNLLALAGAWAAAFYLVIGRRLRERLDLLPYVFVVYGMAALVLLGLMAGAGHGLAGHPGRVWFWCLLLALVPQLLGHTSFNWALKWLPASFVSVTLLGEPVGSTLLAMAFLGEWPGPAQLAGAALILAGIAGSAGRSGDEVG